MKISKRLKMRKASIILSIILMLSNITLNGQKRSTTDCYPIKYLDFFLLDKIENIKWSDTELDKLMTLKMPQNQPDSSIKTNFLVPMIASQLRNSSPECLSKIDTAYFNKLLLLYCKIRYINCNSLKSNTLQEKFNFIRDDFYQQIDNEKYLPYITYTLDDGPFYGIDYEKIDSLETLSSQKMDFGKLSISKIQNKIILTCSDNNKIIWQKAITKGANTFLKDLQFNDGLIFKSSVATVVKMYSEGERFSLYLKNDGRFLYYFHSW